MINESLDDFKKAWKDHAPSVKEAEWKTSKRKKIKQSPGTSTYDAEIVSPGSTAKVALEKNHRQISIHAIPQNRQKELCAILVDVCKKSNINVNPKRIHKTKNGIRYLRFEVNEDKKLVRKILRGREISFYFKIKTSGGEQLLKYFSFDLSSHRNRRWSSWSHWSIPKENLFPDYNQHTCCGCYSGCSPVAWAQILGYYDRLAYYSPSSGYSRRFWTCKDAGSNSWGDCVAPKTMTSWNDYTNVKKYVEGIRNNLGTYCSAGGGSTKHSQMINIIKFYRTRGIGGRVFSYYNRNGRTKNRFRDRAANHVKAGYPAIVGIWVTTKKKAAHSAVATRYSERYRKYRSCFLFWCKTKTSWEKRFYLHMGWGGYSNGWYTAQAFAAYCAKKY